VADARAQNVVLISLDTLRYDCIAAAGERAHLSAWDMEGRLRTPNLDAFWGDSVCFTRARTAAPYTTSAHASVMTGLYPNAHGVRALYRWGLRPQVGTLAEELGARGWRTVAMQESGERTQLRTGSQVLRGFDHFVRDEMEAAQLCADASEPCLLFLHTLDLHSPYCWSAFAVASGQTWAWEEAEAEIYRRLAVPRPAGGDRRPKPAFERWVVDQARRRLGEREAARLFLHWYVLGVNWFDAARWPRIVQALRRTGLYDDALIIAFADHGEALLPDGDGRPMDHPPVMLEDAVRVPLMVRAPGLEPGPRAEPASLVDVAPTVMDWLGPEPDRLGRAGAPDGLSLMGPLPADRLLLTEGWQTLPPRGVVRHADKAWRQRASTPAVPHQVGAVRGETKVVWQWGEGLLRRFMSGGRRRWLAVRRVARRLLPGPLWDGLRAVRAHLRGAKASPAPTGAQTYPWRDGTVFVCDVAADPLDARPRRAHRGDLGPREAELLDGIREYWEQGVLGAPIELTEEEDARVTAHLRALGYMD